MNFAGIDKLSLVDYDEKVCCVLFSKGCNFRCPFCHNSILVTKIDDSEIEFDDILEYLIERKNKIDAVVISGGEPTLMPDLVDKIKAIKKLGFLIKLDTNGSSPNLLKYLIESKLIDYVAMDIKNSFDKYGETIGANVDLSLIKKSIALLEESKIEHEYRTTLIHEFHSEKSIEEMCKSLKGTKKLFFQHFVNSERCISQNLHDVKKDEAEKFVEIAKKYVENVDLRGY